MSKDRYEQGSETAVPPFRAAIGFMFGVFTLAMSVLATAVIGLA